MPPGWSEWYACSDDQEVYNYRLNENGTPVHYGDQPADFKQDVLTRKAVGLHRPSGAEAEARSSSGSPTRRRTGAVFRTRTRRRTAAAPRRRRRATPMPSTPSRCRSPRTSTSPTSPTSRPRSGSHPLLSASQIADIQRRYRCQLESLLSVDEGVKKVVQALVAKGELANTLLDLHLGQWLLQRGAPDPPREGADLRGVDPGAAPDARPRHPAGRDGQRPGDQRRPGPDDRRRREREPRPGHGRALADSGRRAAGHRAGTRAPDRAAGRRRPRLRGDPHRALHVRRAQQRREGALRPAERPVRASESARQPPPTHRSRRSSLPVCTSSRAAQAAPAGYIRPQPWPSSPRRP